MIREPLRGMLDDGAAMPVSEYDAAHRSLRESSTKLGAVFEGFDALPRPGRAGEAPEVSSTGDPIFNRAWSALGVPASHRPRRRRAVRLPLGVQIVDLPRHDARVLACAAWIETALARTAGI